LRDPLRVVIWLLTMLQVFLKFAAASIAGKTAAARAKIRNFILGERWVLKDGGLSATIAVGSSELYF